MLVNQALRSWLLSAHRAWQKKAQYSGTLVMLNAQRHGLNQKYRLTLSNNRLTTLPMALALLSRLRYLNLKNNNFWIEFRISFFQTVLYVLLLYFRSHKSIFRSFPIQHSLSRSNSLDFPLGSPSISSLIRIYSIIRFYQVFQSILSIQS